jgi:hypothetical protein
VAIRFIRGCLFCSLVSFPVRRVIPRRSGQRPDGPTSLSRSFLHRLTPAATGSGSLMVRPANTATERRGYRAERRGLPRRRKGVGPIIYMSGGGFGRSLELSAANSRRRWQHRPTTGRAARRQSAVATTTAPAERLPYRQMDACARVFAAVWDESGQPLFANAHTRWRFPEREKLFTGYSHCEQVGQGLADRAVRSHACTGSPGKMREDAGMRYRGQGGGRL